MTSRRMKKTRGRDVRGTRGQDARDTRIARGFTLLEILLASTMVALLAGSLYASLHIAFKARNSALSAVDTVRKCNLTIDLIRSDLQSAVLPGTSATTAISVSFVGLGGSGATSSGNADLIFYASTADILPSPGIGDIKRVEYACVPSDDGQFMLVRFITTNLLAPISPDPIEEVICRNVRAFTVMYYDGTAWQESWDSTTTSPKNALPKAVEVIIEINDDAGRPATPVSRVIAIPVGQGLTSASPTGSAT